MTAIITWLASFLTGPLLKAGIDAWKMKLQSETDHDKISFDLAARELLVQQREMELQTQLRVAEIGKWYEPDKMMGYFVALYFGKLLIWDKVLALGSTDALGGFAATAANLIVVFYFGKRGIENVAKIITRK
jgi:hypothetical protein